MAVLVPKKNILKPGSEWVLHANTVAVNDYYLRVTQTGTYQTSSLPVTLKPGVQYTLSADEMSQYAQLYIKRIINGVYAYHIASVASGNTVTFTAVDNATYSVEFHNGTTLGEGYVMNFQLEEGMRTPFKRYEPMNSPATLPKEVINSDISGSASHIYPYGNIIQVKEDVRLWGYQIQVGTPTGTFDSVIYEWNNGAIGEPLFREVVNASVSGVMNLSFKGTLLKAGKKYYIGRNDPNRNNDSTGNAGVYRKTGMPGADFKYITTLGGSQFYSPAIDFPSTWYYTFSLEVESVKNKAAGLSPETNLIPSFNDPAWFTVTGATIGIDPINPYKSRIDVTTPGNSYMIQIPVETGKTYTFSFKSMTGLYRLYKTAVTTHDVTVLLANDANPGKPDTYTFTVDASYKGIITLRLTHSLVGSWYFENLQLEKKIIKSDFEPLRLGNKAAAMSVSQSPGQNLVPPLSDPGWFVKIGTKGEIVSDYEYHMVSAGVGVVGYDIPITLKPNTTYTLGATVIGTGARMRLMRASDDTFLININPTAPIQSYTTNSITDYKIRLENNGQAGDYTTKDFYLYEGVFDNPTFKPALTANKKAAQLYPAKNFVLPYKDWIVEPEAGMDFEYTDRTLIIKFNATQQYKGLRMPIDMNIFNLLRGKTVTLSCSYILRDAAASQVQLRFFGGASGNTDFVLALNTGAAQAITKTIPDDFTGVFLVAQSNIVGQSQLTVKDLQLEIGSGATAWNKYNLGNR